MALTLSFRRNANICATAAAFTDALYIDKHPATGHDGLLIGGLLLGAFYAACCAVCQMKKIEIEEEQERQAMIDAIGTDQPALYFVPS